MKVGVYYDLRNAKGWFRPYPQFYAEALEHMQAMDELGMHSLNFSEHHFDPDGYCPSVIVWSAAAAVRTKRAKISQNLVLIPFLHPVRLAEDIATIDILSNGRAWLMAGTGHRAHEFAAFGVERKERTPRTIEGMEIIRKCFTEEEFSYAGKYYNLQNVRMQPRPVQKPHPPMFWGTTVYKFNLRPLERIVEHGFGAATAMGVSFPPDVDAWENWYEQWIGAIRRLGKDPTQYQTTTILTLWVTDD
ncbi:MAG: LLM class flavin-dependent oxidoreductase, partial [Chloroflexi bacterium]|nr:LLM class flavin-dependent oxidoreductase [Chloroflexota bacterium]